MLRDPASDGKQVVYTVVSRGKRLGKAIRTQRYRYSRWQTGEELYDLAEDPHERKNLADHPKYGSTLETMRKHLADVEAKAVARKR